MINPAVSALYDGSMSLDSSLYLIGRKRLQEAAPAAKYELLRALYDDNGLYDTVARSLQDEGIWLQALKPLANPTNQVIEFYAEHLLADLDLLEHTETENDAIVDPLIQVWRWSNFDAKKILLGRMVPRDGDGFMRVVVPEQKDKVTFEIVDPSHVVDFDTDQRGYITWIRIEVRYARGDDRDINGQVREFHHVEVWDKWSESYRRWEIDANRVAVIETDLSKLGTPVEDLTFKDMGLSFIPVVHVPFRDVGETRGQAAVWPSIGKIVELDTIVTALHQNYFAYDRPTQAIESMGMDKDGRFTPPPPVSADSTGTDNSGRDVIRIGSNQLWRLPAGWTLRTTVPDINFEAGTAMVKEYWTTLERQLPELLYSRISEIAGNDVSGRAIRFMLSGAVKRAEQARFNLEQGLVRAHMMALTMGANAGLKEFSNLGGTFDDGKFVHSFKVREIIPTSESEDAETEALQAQAFAAWITAGMPMTEALKRAGYTDEQIVEILDNRSSEIEGDNAVTDSNVEQ